jgi:hypothetical protein
MPWLPRGYNWKLACGLPVRLIYQGHKFCSIITGHDTLGGFRHGTQISHCQTH